MRRGALTIGCVLAAVMALGASRAAGFELKFLSHRKAKSSAAQPAGCGAGGCSWLRPNTALPAGKLKVLHENGALVVEHGQGVTLRKAGDVRLGDAQEIVIGGKPHGMLMTGADGARTLTLVSPQLGGTVHLTMPKDTTKPPSIVIVAQTPKGVQRQNFSAADPDAAVTVIKSLGGPVIAATRFDMARTASEKGVWAELDGVPTDLSATTPRALASGDRADLGKQLNAAADLFRALSIPSFQPYVSDDQLRPLGIARPRTPQAQSSFNSKSEACRSCVKSWGLGD